MPDSRSDEQLPLFDLESGMTREEIDGHWQAMPEYDNRDEPEPAITATFKFRTEEDYELFNELLKEFVYKTNKVFDGMQRKEAKQAWFPLKEKGYSYEYRTPVSGLCDQQGSMALTADG